MRYATEHSPTPQCPTVLTFASPPKFYKLCQRLGRPLVILAFIAGFFGLIIGFVIAPTDAQQGDSYRIIYLHVPAACKRLTVPPTIQI